MTRRSYTIGTLARLSGLSVRKIRFYSDAGLLPPAGRTEKGYRVFDDSDIARLTLISALREADVALKQIKQIVSSDRTLAEVLKLRLEALEIEISSRRRMSALLRATLSRQASESDLTEMWNAMRLSRSQFERSLEDLYQRAADGLPLKDEWKQQMIAHASAELPQDPSAQQISAWTELTAMIEDPAFLRMMQEDFRTVWNDRTDPVAYQAAAHATYSKTQSALRDGTQPTSKEGIAIAREWVAGSAAAMSREPDADFIQWHLDQYDRYSDRRIRYQHLKEILSGEQPNPSAGAEWQWINEGLKYLRSSIEIDGSTSRPDRDRTNVDRLTKQPIERASPHQDRTSQQSRRTRERP